MVLIWIYLMTDDVDNALLLMDYWYVCLETYILRSFVFKLGHTIFVLLSCRGSSYILDTEHISDTWLNNISFHPLKGDFSKLSLYCSLIYMF